VRRRISRSLKVFFCYPRADRKYRDNVERALSLLKRQRRISTFYDGVMTAGEEWEDRIIREIDSSDIVLLLLSDAFFDSRDCFQKEMRRAVRRHRDGKAIVVPVLVKPCDWKMGPLSRLNALPDGTKAIVEWRPQSKAYENIALRMRRLVEHFPQRGSGRRTPPRPRAETGLLVDYKTFYGDDIRERHSYDFKAERVEVVEKEGQPVAVPSEPLKTIRAWLKGEGRVLVVCGSGGLGKSRLLIETAKLDKRVRFAPTRLWYKGFPKLAEELAKAAGKRDVVVFDDCQGYSDGFLSLLKAALGTKARVIAATRYCERIETALLQAHASREILRLRPLVNAAVVVPETNRENLRSIGRIAAGIPAFAVMVYLQFKRTRNLRGIADRFGLMKSMLKDLVETGEKAGFADTRELLAEMAVRNGLWQDHEPFPGHEALVPKLKAMGHIGVSGTIERRAYGIVPDQLRDFIIREVYAPEDVFQCEAFNRMLGRLPDDDATQVIEMLGIQFRETGNDVWKRACRLVLEKYKARSHEGGIGFAAGPGRRGLELLVDIGYEAWESFGDRGLVVDGLGDFCAGADKLESVEHLNKAALFYHQTGDWGRALECYEQGIRVAKRDKDKLWATTFLGNVGLIWQDKGEFDKALRYHEKALTIAREIGDKQGVASALGNIANICRAKGKLDKALRYHEKALAIDREIEDKQGVATDLGNIGLIYRAKDELDKALEHLKEALKIAREIEDKLGVANQLGNIGLIWQDKGEFDKALEYHEEALKMDREIGYQQGVATDLGNIGLIWQHKGEPDKALEHLEEALKIDREIGYQQGVATQLRNVGLVRVDEGAHERAVEPLVTALGMFLEGGIADGPAECRQGLSECLKVMGRDKFVARCVEAGMPKSEAEELAAKLARPAATPDGQPDK
jgi:tetratricopeptide (TPR) repeat protein